MFHNRTFGTLFHLAISLFVWFSFLPATIFTAPAIRASEYPAGSTAPLIFDSTSLQAEAPSVPTTFYVDKRATGAKTGLSWLDAFTDLQSALEIVASGDQIWVATGIYTPTHQTSPTDPRTATFRIVEGAKIYGGFNGDETDIRQRNWRLHPSILSGDLNGDDGPDGFSNNDENSYHVVTAAGILNTYSRLDGFIIQGGNANGAADPYKFGGGLYNQPSTGSPSLANLIFYRNYADVGGGLYNVQSDALVVNVAWIGNRSDYGGGLRNFDSNPTLINTLFVGNTASSRAGAIYNTGSHPVFVNCTVADNSASYSPGAVLNDKDLVGKGAEAEFKNCIIWGNTPGQIDNETGPPASITGLFNALIQGGCVGVGITCYQTILSSDPQFMDPLGPDMIPGTLDDNYRLRGSSPAIDAGYNPHVPNDDLDINYNGNVLEKLPLDLGGLPRFMGREQFIDGGMSPTVDMGAYEAKPMLFLPLIRK